MTTNKNKMKRNKVNTIISFSPSDNEKLRAVCDAKFMSKVGYIRKIVLPVLQKDFKEVEKCKSK